jgi:predicted small integral membrane protein
MAGPSEGAAGAVQGGAEGVAPQGTTLVSWMAWTPETAYFFTFIASLLVIMTVWELAVPGGGPRRGILGLDTTRGDRLFISLLGSAFIHLAWLALVGTYLWPAVAVSVIYALCVFLFV